MGAARLKSHENEREIFHSCPRLSYVSPKCVNQPQPDPTVPRAYLKYIHYDPDSQFVSMGHMPISDEANEGYQQLLLQLVAQEDGFVQFFVANETLRDVYFDDITGMVRRPKIIQEGHYNPFGLPLAGLTTLGNPEYAYFFTWKELYEDEALQWYDYGARMYDVQIGRWTTHDPLYQDASPYVFCGNNPINMVDLDGRWSFFQSIFSSQKSGGVSLNEALLKSSGPSSGNGPPGFLPDPNPQFWNNGSLSYYRSNGMSAWTSLDNVNNQLSLELIDPRFKQANWTRAQFDLSFSRSSGIDYYSAIDNLPTFSFGSLKDIYMQMSQSMDFYSAISDFAKKRNAPGWRETFDNTELKALLEDGGVGQAMVKIGGKWDTKFTTSVLGRLVAQGGEGEPPIAKYAGDQSKYPGAIIIETSLMSGGAVTLPPFVFTAPGKGKNQDLIRHEYGHILQYCGLSILSGSPVTGYGLYLLGIGVPSILSADKANNDPNHFHQGTFTEKSANQLSYWFYGMPANWKHTYKDGTPAYPVYWK